MLLTELIDFNRERPITTPDRNFVRIQLSRSKKLKEIGQGVQTYAYHHKHPTKPNQIVKHVLTTINPLEDPHISFLKIAAEHQDNPHFPKIYSLKMYNTKFENSEVIYTTEKLLSLASSKLTHDDYTNQQDWYKQHPDQAVSDYGSIHTLTHHGINVDHLGRLFSDLEASDKYDDLIDTTKLPAFAEALRLVKPLFSQFTFDMHEGNIMVRLTSTGPQLVIVDPVFMNNHPAI